MPAVDEALREALLPELEVLRPLGSGITAEVLLARETALQRLVAVKVLRADVAADAVARQRFEREAQAAARIVHPHVTGIHRVGRLPDERPFIVMEYVEGRTLADLLGAGAPLDLSMVRRIVAAIADALGAAHARGIVHRDVRPGNVLVENRTGRAVLGDFGIAALLESGSATATRLTTAGMMLGDTEYLSPEQVRGEAVVEQSDVYGLGLLAYRMLTGSSPYQARTDAERLVAHVRQEPRPLQELRADADPALTAIVHQCLAKDPNQRPLAAEVAHRLRDQPGSREVTGGGALEQFLGELRRRRVYQVLAAYTAVAIGIFGIIQVIFEAFELSLQTYRITVAATLAGFPVSLVLAWIYDIHAGRVSRTQPTQSSAAARALMWLGLTIIVAFVAAAGWLLLGREP